MDNDCDCRGVQLNAPTGNEYFSKILPKKNTLGIIVRTFKGSVKKYCNENGFKHFQWQRNYYEYIIRGEENLDKVRDYIISNSGRWNEDRNHPKNIQNRQDRPTKITQSDLLAPRNLGEVGMTRLTRK